MVANDLSHVAYVNWRVFASWWRFKPPILMTSRNWPLSLRDSFWWYEAKFSNWLLRCNTFLEGWREIFGFWRIWSLQGSLMWSGSLRRCDSDSLILLLGIKSDLLKRQFIFESINRIPSFDLVSFFVCVLLDEVTNVHVSTTYSNKQIVSFLDFDVHSFLSELVNSFGLSQKQDVHLLSFRILIDEVSQCFIYLVTLPWNINCLLIGA